MRFGSGQLGDLQDLIWAVDRLRWHAAVVLDNTWNSCLSRTCALMGLFLCQRWPDPYNTVWVALAASKQCRTMSNHVDRYGDKCSKSGIQPSSV